MNRLAACVLLCGGVATVAAATTTRTTNPTECPRNLQQSIRFGVVVDGRSFSVDDFYSSDLQDILSEMHSKLSWRGLEMSGDVWYSATNASGCVQRSKWVPDVKLTPAALELASDGESKSLSSSRSSRLGLEEDKGDAFVRNTISTAAWTIMEETTFEESDARRMVILFVKLPREPTDELTQPHPGSVEVCDGKRKPSDMQLVDTLRKSGVGLVVISGETESADSWDLTDKRYYGKVFDQVVAPKDNKQDWKLAIWHSACKIFTATTTADPKPPHGLILKAIEGK